jgi:hypothetical protein
MRHALADLLRNLRAGLRLAFFRPVERLAFRVDLPQVLLLFVLSALIDVAGDAWRIDGPRAFSLFGAGSELYSGALLLLTAALIALMNRQRDLALAIPVLVLASMPIVQVLHYVLIVVAMRPEGLPFDGMLESLVVLWIVMVLVRSVAVAFTPPPVHGWLRAIGGGMLLAAPIWFANALFPNAAWWIDDAPDQSVSGGMNAGNEAVLATQAFVLNHALDALAEERPERSDLYFVGFAPYGRDDAYRKGVEAAQKIMDARWDTMNRSVLLLNSPQTLISAPFATVTNLRETLNEIGSIIDPDDDVVMVYLAGRSGPDHRLDAAQPPLSLVELSPSGLKQLLADAGIKWRIIVVSACYAGGYIEPLRDEYTMIVTSSQSDRQSFGCGERTDAAFFGDAFFAQGVAKGDSLEAAFAGARERVAAREREAGYAPPSSPQIHVGAEIAGKLKVLQKRGGGGATVAAPTARVHG